MCVLEVLLHNIQFLYSTYRCEKCAVLGCYTASSGDSLQVFLDSLVKGPKDS